MKVLFPYPTSPPTRSGNWLKLWGRDRGRLPRSSSNQVQERHKMRGREVANPRPKRPPPKFRRNLGDQRRFLRKIRNFSKNLSSFFTTFRPKSRLSISKGRSPIRARVRTQAGEIKTSESRHASIRQKSGWLDSRATSWRRPNASCWSRTSHSADADIRARDPEGTPDSRVH